MNGANDKTEWSEPSLVEYEFRFGVKNQAALARLGVPRPDEAHPAEWVCAFQIRGLKDGKIRLARGGDGLQAVTIASNVIRKWLDRLKIVNPEIVNPDRVAHEVIFPRYVPFCYSLEFHWKLCNMLDAEIKKKDRQLSRRRLAHEKSVKSPSRRWEPPRLVAVSCAAVRFKECQMAHVSYSQLRNNLASYMDQGAMIVRPSS